MKDNNLTATEIKYLKIFDRRDIRIRIARESKNQSKWPLIENWTTYYSEPLTISRMLEQGFNYGIRTGKPIGNYFNLVLDLDDLWAKIRIQDSRYVETNQGIHRYLLIKELPKSCWLVNKYGDHIGELHSKGRFVVGIGSIHEKGTRYSLKGRTNVKFSLHFETLREFQAFLNERDIKTTPWGKKGLENVRDLQLYEPKKLKQPENKLVAKPKQPSKEQKYFQKKDKLEKKINNHPKKSDLNTCYLCLVYFPKEPDIIKSHLQGKKHQKNWKTYQQKNFPQNRTLGGNKAVNIG